MDTPLLWHIPVSHFNEKVRWTLDYKRIAHRRCIPATQPRGAARSHWKTISTSSPARRCARPSSRRCSGTTRTSLCAC